MKRLQKKIGFIGAGNMGEAMINGLVESGLCEPTQIWASDLREARLRQLKDTYKINITEENTEIVDEADIVILAVKPQDMDQLLKRVSSTFPHTLKGVKLLISIAAGYPIKRIERHLYPSLDVNSKGLLPIQVDLEASFCIHCGLCVRYCAEVKKKDAIGFIDRGIRKEISFIPEIAAKECNDCKTPSPSR